MHLHVGTSGYGYKEWKGKFYPAEMPADAMLQFYAARFGTVEINNTFYRMPTKTLLKSWLKQAPSEFIFGLKAPQRITHLRRLKNAKPDVAEFLKLASVFKKQLGPILFQLPGNFKKDAERLRDFIKLLPSKRRCAFEFRDESWFDEEIFAILKKRNIALCVVDSDETLSSPLEATADWGYLRLRRLDYTKHDLRKWLTRIQQQPWSETFIFFKHEERALGPKFAKQFMQAASLVSTDDDRAIP